MNIILLNLFDFAYIYFYSCSYLSMGDWNGDVGVGLFQIGGIRIEQGREIRNLAPLRLQRQLFGPGRRC